MKKIIYILTALLLTSALYAAPKGAYIGLGYGNSDFADGGYQNDLNDVLRSAGSSVRIDDDYKDSATKVYAGYQFNRIIALEASYTKFATLSLNATNQQKMELDPSSLALTANLGYSIGKDSLYRPFVLVGISSVSIEKTGDIDDESKKKRSGLKLGIGFEYTPKELKGVGFRIAHETDIYVLEEDIDEKENIYIQSLNLFYFGVSYKF